MIDTNTTFNTPTASKMKPDLNLDTFLSQCSYYAHGKIPMCFRKSITFTVLINYSCFAEVYMISKHPHVLYTAPKQHSGELLIFFSLIPFSSWLA